MKYLKKGYIMDWNSMMKNEFRKAGLDVKIQKVPKNRRASNASITELEERIKYKIMENDAMRVKSRSIAISMSIR